MTAALYASAANLPIIFKIAASASVISNSISITHKNNVKFSKIFLITSLSDYHTLTFDSLFLYIFFLNPIYKYLSIHHNRSVNHLCIYLCINL